jgi:hypothetical protein
MQDLVYAVGGSFECRLLAETRIPTLPRTGQDLVPLWTLIKSKHLIGGTRCLVSDDLTTIISPQACARVLYLYHLMLSEGHLWV